MSPVVFFITRALIKTLHDVPVVQQYVPDFGLRHKTALSAHGTHPPPGVSKPGRALLESEPRWQERGGAAKRVSELQNAAGTRQQWGVAPGW